MACLHRVAMATLLLSRRSWSVHLVRGRPGGRFRKGSGGRPTDGSTWRSMAWYAGVLSAIHIRYGKTRMAGLQSGEGHTMIDSVVWAQYVNVTDTQNPRHRSKCCVNALCRAAKTMELIKTVFGIETLGAQETCRHIRLCSRSPHPWRG